MTIAGMLRKLGHNTPRYVDHSGRVRFKPSTNSAVNGFAVTPHTFHGGEEHMPPLDTGRRWWEMPEVLDRDRQEMRVHFPEFREIPASEGLPPAWIGSIDTGYGRFSIAVCHRTDRSLPCVIPLAPKQRRRSEGRFNKQSPHLYLNGHLCVAAADDWNPERDSIATVVAWTAHWHACYVEWHASGQWPTEGFEARAA